MIKIEEFSDCILVKIFHYLLIRELCSCSRVCRRWKRVADDSSLWTDVDLRPFRWRLDEHCIIRMIQTRFKPCLKKLNLSGFSLTPRVFYELDNNCPSIAALILQNVTFIGFKELNSQKFPSNLQMLDLRYSSGDKEAFVFMAKYVENLRGFGIPNHILEYSNSVEMFHKLKQVQTIEFSYCNSLFDATLILVGTFCKALTSLSLCHCNNINGLNLSLIIDSCKNLKALSFSGTSLTNTHFMQCNWSSVQLEELDVSWCRNITESGLRSVLPNLNKLVYLRLCSCGFGHAITDRVLNVIMENHFSQLQILDLSYSREVTNYATSKLIYSLPELTQLRISCCRRLTIELLNNIKSVNNNLLVIASFKEHDENSITNEDGFSIYPDPEEARSVRRYSLEKDLKELQLCRVK